MGGDDGCSSYVQGDSIVNTRGHKGGQDAGRLRVDQLSSETATTFSKRRQGTGSRLRRLPRGGGREREGEGEREGERERDRQTDRERDRQRERERDRERERETERERESEREIEKEKTKCERAKERNDK